MLIGGRVLPWSYERILGWVGGVRKFLSLKELRYPVRKNGPPLSRFWYAWTCFNEWSLHSASIFNNLLGRQLLAKNFTDHLLDHMSRSRTLFERSSHPSKSFLCISMCMLQSGALVFVGRLVEAILWREFLPRCRIHLPCVWHDGNFETALCVGKIDVMNMKLPGKTKKTSDGSLDHMGNKHSFLVSKVCYLCYSDRDINGQPLIHAYLAENKSLT